MEIEYRYLPGTDHKYCAGSDGFIYHVKESGLVRLSNDISSGYARVRIAGKRCQVHNLVASAFIEKEFPALNTVGHKDGDKLNNRPENLYWASLSELCQR